jgi:hypothetical protein
LQSVGLTFHEVDSHRRFLTEVYGPYANMVQIGGHLFVVEVPANKDTVLASALSAFRGESWLITPTSASGKAQKTGGRPEIEAQLLPRLFPDDFFENISVSPGSATLILFPTAGVPGKYNVNAFWGASTTHVVDKLLIPKKAPAQE